jgi:hypothetical protein
MVESVGDAGMIVEQGSDRGLAEALLTMSTETDTYRTFRRKAEERSHLFGYERYREQVEEIFGSTSNDG